MVQYSGVACLKFDRLHPDVFFDFQRDADIAVILHASSRNLLLWNLDDHVGFAIQPLDWLGLVRGEWVGSILIA